MKLETIDREDSVRSWESVRLEISDAGTVVASSGEMVSLEELISI